MNKPVFALVDCNNFYVSCERTFNPALRDKAVVVLSNNDGCIIARSNEAKQLGIPMCAPLFKYAGLIKKYGVKVFSPNYTLYGDMSNRVMHLLSEYCADIEVYSVDEVFLRLDTVKNESYIARSLSMRQGILRATGIPASIGIADTKTLAKIANHIAKKRMPSGVFHLKTGAVDEALASFEIQEVWGVGWRLGAKLRDMKITTALQLKEASATRMRSLFGVTVARIVYELNGEPCLDLEEWTAKKQILCSRSFSPRLTELSSITEAIAAFCAKACENLRQQNSVANAVEVFLGTSRFNEREPRYSNKILISLDEATDDTGYIIAAAISGLKQIFCAGYHYQKAGIMLINLIDKAQYQQSLFSSMQNRDALMSVIDRINHKMGKKTVFFAAEGIAGTQLFRCDNRSPNYTSSWKELLNVIA